jgi:octopine/nopaline transport system substrate-binding protein
MRGGGGTDTTISFEKDPEGAKKAIEAWKPLLKGKTVGVQTSTVNSQFLEKYLKDTITIREYKTTEQHDLDLSAGRLDAIFAGYGALIATKDKPEFKDMMIAGTGMRGDVLGRGVAVGMRKDEPELKALFDEAIKAVIADGTALKLSLKWFKTDVIPQS